MDNERRPQAWAGRTWAARGCASGPSGRRWPRCPW